MEQTGCIVEWKVRMRKNEELKMTPSLGAWANKWVKVTHWIVEHYLQIRFGRGIENQILPMLSAHLHLDRMWNYFLGWAGLGSELYPENDGPCDITIYRDRKMRITYQKLLEKLEREKEGKDRLICSNIKGRIISYFCLNFWKRLDSYSIKTP